MSKKKVIVISVVAVLVVGVGLTAAGLFLGFIRIPGLKIGPQKPVAATINKASPKTESKPVAKFVPVAKKVDPPPPAPKPDPEKGYRKLAETWNLIEPPKLKKVVQKWTPVELASVLVYMDDEKVGPILAELEDKQASLVMKAIEEIASRPVQAPPKA